MSIFSVKAAEVRAAWAAKAAVAAEAARAEAIRVMIANSPEPECPDAGPMPAKYPLPGRIEEKEARCIGAAELERYRRQVVAYNSLTVALSRIETEVKGITPEDQDAVVRLDVLEAKYERIKIQRRALFNALRWRTKEVLLPVGLPAEVIGFLRVLGAYEVFKAKKKEEDAMAAERAARRAMARQMHEKRGPTLKDVLSEIK